MSWSCSLKKPGKALLLILILAFAISVLAAGCMGQKSEKDIAIGVAWPFENNNSLFKEGIELAVKEINENGGINGSNIRLEMKDDQASVSVGMSIAQSFAKDNQIVAVIGHRNSFISIPTSRIYEEAGKVMLSPASTAPELTDNGYNYVFRNIPDDSEIAQKVAIYAYHQGLKNMVIYYSEDSYGIGLANSFEDHAKSAGIKIVDRITYYGDLKDLERQHEKWKSLDFDGIFIAQGIPAGPEFIADCAKTGISVPFFAGNAMDSPLLHEMLGGNAEGIVIGSVFSPADSREAAKIFNQSFNREYKQQPSPYSALGYDGVKILAEAIRRAGSTDPTAIAEQLHNLKNWPGVVGYHSFDDNGNDIGNLLVLKTIKDGKLQ